MKAFAVTIIVLGAGAFLLGMHFFLTEQKLQTIMAVLLSVSLIFGGAALFEYEDKKETRVPAITDARGNTYVSHVKTVTNKYHDTYYSIPQNTLNHGTEQKGWKK